MKCDRTFWDPATAVSVWFMLQSSGLTIVSGCCIYRYLTRQVSHNKVCWKQGNLRGEVYLLIDLFQWKYTYHNLHSLGGSPDDAKEVMRDPFFSKVNWDDTLHKRVRGRPSNAFSLTQLTVSQFSFQISRWVRKS